MNWFVIGIKLFGWRAHDDVARVERCLANLGACLRDAGALCAAFGLGWVSGWNDALEDTGCPSLRR